MVGNTRRPLPHWRLKRDREDDPPRQIEALGERLSRLRGAGLHIDESLDVDTGPQGVLDSARALTRPAAVRSHFLTSPDGYGTASDRH